MSESTMGESNAKLYERLEAALRWLAENDVLPLTIYIDVSTSLVDSRVPSVHVYNPDFVRISPAFQPISRTAKMTDGRFLKTLHISFPDSEGGVCFDVFTVEGTFDDELTLAG